MIRTRMPTPTTKPQASTPPTANWSSGLPSRMARCSVVLVKMKRERYVWVTLVPACGILFVTCFAGLQKLFHSDPRISFLAHAQKYSTAAAEGKILAPAKTAEEMSRIVWNDYVNSGLTVLFLSVVVIVAFHGLRVALKARKVAWPTAKEVPATFRNEVEQHES